MSESWPSLGIKFMTHGLSNWSRIMIASLPLEYCVYT